MRYYDAEKLKPLKEWHFQGFVQYEINATNPNSCQLFYLYNPVSGLPATRRKRLGICKKDPRTGYWVGQHKRGYRVYFSNPTPVGYGVITGELAKMG